MKIQYFLITMVISSLACGQMTLPTNTPEASNRQEIRRTAEKPVPTAEYTALGRVNVRQQPNTDSEVLGYVEFGAVLAVVGSKIETPDVLDCPRWYQIDWRGGVGYVCAGWVSK